MATIVKRKNRHCVVYYYVDSNGKKKQRWESYTNRRDAEKRKAQVEHETLNNTFIAPDKQTVEAFLKDFVSLYGEQNWSLSTYDSNAGLIRNYINPVLGQEVVQDITPKMIDMYYKKLGKTRSVNSRGKKPRNEYLSHTNIERIHKLLKCAFKQAVRWELISRNPFDYVTLKKTKYKPREIWTADIIRKALDSCKNGMLYVAMNLAFACSLREGEILGLTWDNVHISDADIAADDTYVYIDKELTRASLEILDILDNKDVMHVFKPLLPNTTTRVVLKKPKTDSSIRKVWLPKTVAYILREWKKSQDAIRDYLGDEYEDHNLVVALANGRPCEGRVLLKEFERLKKEAGLPNVVFHSLRHSSTTYKLKLNHGDLKATQGDTGHAEIDMITKIYAHILDDDRKINAQKFEMAFYAKPTLRDVRPSERPEDTINTSFEVPEPQPPKLDLVELVTQIQNSPETAAAIAALLAGTKGTT